MIEQNCGGSETMKLFSDYLQKDGQLQDGVAELLNERQEAGTLEAMCLLSGQVWLTKKYMEWEKLSNSTI